MQEQEEEGKEEEEEEREDEEDDDTEKIGNLSACSALVSLMQEKEEEG